jgi:hypothetical protein
MSTLVTNEFFAQPGRGDDVASLLLEILGESLQHDGCETVRILRDQDDPDHPSALRNVFMTVRLRMSHGACRRRRA